MVWLLVKFCSTSIIKVLHAFIIPTIHVCYRGVNFWRYYVILINDDFDIDLIYFATNNWKNVVVFPCIDQCNYSSSSEGYSRSTETASPGLSGNVL